MLCGLVTVFVVIGLAVCPTLSRIAVVDVWPVNPEQKLHESSEGALAVQGILSSSWPYSESYVLVMFIKGLIGVVLSSLQTADQACHVWG